MLLLGAVGVFWAGIVLPSFFEMAQIQDISLRIIADDRFKSGVLANVLHRAETAPQRFILQPEFARAVALITLRTAEEAIQKKSSEDGDREIAIAAKRLAASLFVNPTDAFFWLMLYSVETMRNGFDPKYIAYLDQSYATGPFDGWIALRRNREALAAFSLLNDNGQKLVAAEFDAMVDSDFIEDAALNITTVGWGIRERLAASLEHVNLASRQMLAKRLAQNGVKIKIPGVELEDRPWR